MQGNEERRSISSTAIARYQRDDLERSNYAKDRQIETLQSQLADVHQRLEDMQRRYKRQQSERAENALSFPQPTSAHDVEVKGELERLFRSIRAWSRTHDRGGSAHELVRHSRFHPGLTDVSWYPEESLSLSGTSFASILEATVSGLITKHILVMGSTWCGNCFGPFLAQLLGVVEERKKILFPNNLKCCSDALLTTI
jgi:hypothetical protein